MWNSSGAWRRLSVGSKALAWFELRLVPPLRTFGARPSVVAIRQALPWSFLGLIVALVPLALLAPATTGSPWMQFARRVSFAMLPAFAVMALVLAVVLAVSLAKRHGFTLPAFLVAELAAFALSLPPHRAQPLIGYLALIGQSGLLLAILVGLAAAGIFTWMRRLIGRTKPRRVSADVLAAGVVILAATLPTLAHVSLSGELDLLLAPLARMGDSYAALLVIVIVETMLWVAGIHGPALLAAIVTPVYLTLQVQNSSAFAAHQPLPHIVVVSLFLFVFPGGAGATLPLACMLAFSRVPRLRRLGRLVVIPALLNTNEPLLFGLPIVFDPLLAIPFVLAPVVLATTTYFSVAWGWVARPAFYIPSSLPTFLSTYLATLDPRAVVLVAVNIALATAIYFPFVRVYERHELERNAL